MSKKHKRVPATQAEIQGVMEEIDAVFRCVPYSDNSAKEGIKLHFLYVAENGSSALQKERRHYFEKSSQKAR